MAPSSQCLRCVSIVTAEHPKNFNVAFDLQQSALYGILSSIPFSMSIHPKHYQIIPETYTYAISFQNIFSNMSSTQPDQGEISNAEIRERFESTIENTKSTISTFLECNQWFFRRRTGRKFIVRKTVELCNQHKNQKRLSSMPTAKMLQDGLSNVRYSRLGQWIFIG
ncbi:hypothetical protein CRE_06914 [Caenorhabditis remanei]|uniref:Uncharacterized protein n=1 Tax=Caenorhabditis remanei TaxID=31234 RepID=E3MZL0_CAERE|nr:hypothetical protein CRE_06914 [Caenorhabditis remanei]